MTATATQATIEQRALSNDETNLRTYRVKESPRRAGIYTDDVPEAGSTFTWDGMTTDSDNDITIKSWQGDTRVGPTVWVQPDCVTLVDGEISPARDQGMEIPTVADYVNGLSEQVAVEEAATAESPLDMTETQALAEVVRLRQLLTERNANVEEWRVQRDAAMRELGDVKGKLADMHQKFDEMGQALLEEADRRGWCSEYEEFVEQHPDLGLRKRVSDYRVTMTLSVEVDIDVDEAKDENEARHIARNRDLGEIIYNLDRWEINADITSIDSVEEVEN